MSNLQKTREVFKVKNSIFKAAPNATDVSVDIKKLSDGRFKVRVQTFLPKKKTIVATKSDNSLQRALLKAQEANLKQVRKAFYVKRKNISIRKMYLDEVA